MSEPLPLGTPLAAERVVASPRYLAVKADHVRAATNEWVRLRPARTAPTMIVIAALLSLAAFPIARVLAVLAIHGAMFAYQLSQAARAKRTGIDEHALFVSHLVIGTGQAMVVILTGGLTSPLWPGLIGTTLGTLYVFGKSRESTFAVGYATALVIGIGLLPPSILGPAIPRPYNVLLAGWSIVYMLFLLRKSSAALTESYRQVGETLDKAREDILAGAARRQKSLECIGAKVAHELKNPLSAVKGLVQLLQRSAADDRSRERLEVIASEVSRMEIILRDYLSFSRPLDDLKPERVDLAAVADDVVAVLEARADAAGVTLKRTGDRRAAIGDPRRLKEALLNLVANALEATPRSGVVEVAITAVDEGTSIVVRDTGKGIRPEDLARIGTPFFTTREGGTGLGVVLARAAIKQHGGDVRFESELGRGTTVTVRLPASRDEAHAHG